MNASRFITFRAFGFAGIVNTKNLFGFPLLFTNINKSGVL